MPTYEYACARCGIVEVFQSMRDEPLRACPDCRSKRFQRQISGGAGVIFKGSGFYETDYKRGADYKQAAEKDHGGGTATKQDGAKGEAASASKSDASKSDASKSTKPKPAATKAGSD